MRYNPLEQRIGVPLQWDVKTVFQVKKKKNNVSLYPGIPAFVGSPRGTPMPMDWMMQELGKRGEMTISYDEDQLLPHISS